MATKKIRVYELARELGVDNHLVVDLANELKIGVKSHSSSIDEPSADRVRRLADSRGLKQEPPAPEPEPEPAPPAPAPAPEPAVAESEPRPRPFPADDTAAEPDAPKPAVVRSTHRVVRSTPPPPVRPVEAERPLAPPAATPAPAPPPAPAAGARAGAG